MITKESWGKTAAGKEVFLYTLTNQNGLSVQVTTFGARIVTVYGEDIPQQMAEYARVSGVTKIVVGRTNARVPPARAQELRGPAQ